MNEDFIRNLQTIIRIVREERQALAVADPPAAPAGPSTLWGRPERMVGGAARRSTAETEGRAT